MSKIRANLSRSMIHLVLNWIQDPTKLHVNVIDPTQPISPLPPMGKLTPPLGSSGLHALLKQNFP